MLSLKDKISDKLSLLLSDSPSSAHSPADQSPHANSKEGRTLSSLLSFFLPSQSNDAFSSDKHGGDIDIISPIEPKHHRWDSRSLSMNDRPLGSSYEEHGLERKDKGKLNSNEDDQIPLSDEKVNDENKGTLSPQEGDGESDNTGRNYIGQDIFEDAVDQHSMEKTMPYLTEDSSFISYELYEFLLSSVPNIVKGCQWTLLYSTIKHGISLRTLIRRSAYLTGPCLLIVGDKKGAVFGGLIECPLKPTSKRKYQGTNQSFVFTTIYGEPRLFRPTGANRYYYLCLDDLLALGGGGNFALCLDGDLLTGTSGPSETFGNLCLAHSEEFELKNVELWGFAHSSRYLT
ncbi:TLD domain-containing protein 2 [Impatiens glandulifera]|uniref:TLD domain-containing protein 2 n=1 Tax=Impatiens glandulifera TaxID=253017 RepID=UPI001FB0F99F|nr:TLD domain-containing protein 2 [Impatiens glandulifera]XP_047317146.1 TLD domain-containing protein 2 [Impatiens glandulifera]